MNRDGEVFVIEVFVRSFSVYVDVETYREMSMHAYCAPGAWSGLLKGLESKFKGRVLPPEDSSVLEQLERLIEKFDDEVKVYDVSGVLDKIRAIRRGIRKTPTVIVQGKKYEGLEEIQQQIL